MMYILIYLIIIAVTVASAVAYRTKVIGKLRRYTEVEIGMSEMQMLSIMGRKCSISSLKNNRKKYEWRINASSTGTHANGISYRVYSGVRKVDIYCRNGYVEEIKPYNI